MKTETGEILALEVERYLDASKNDGICGDGSAMLLPSLLVMDFPSLGRIKEMDLKKLKEAGVLDGPQAFRWLAPKNTHNNGTQ